MNEKDAASQRNNVIVAITKSGEQRSGVVQIIIYQLLTADQSQRTFGRYDDRPLYQKFPFIAHLLP